MSPFIHIEPPLRLFSGARSLEMLPKELDRLGVRRAVIFCGSTLVRQGAPLQLVRAAMGARCAGVFDGVRTYSPLPAVRQAAAHLRATDADAVVAVGGGSAMVTARAASILLAEGEDVHQLATQRGPEGRFISPKLLVDKIPQFVVPTSPTTACTKAGSAVFDLRTGQRLALFDPRTRAQAVFVHPELTATAPADLMLSASLNGVAMAVEGLESDASDPLSDALLMHFLRLYANALPR